jgi:hypothetical protein
VLKSKFGRLFSPCYVLAESASRVYWKNTYLAVAYEMNNGSHHWMVVMSVLEEAVNEE